MSSTSSRSPKWFSKIIGNGLNPKGTEEQGPDARARRREQVRRAQRTHRDRKATYVKALEHEVAKLRARDVSHDDEIREYREIICRLRGLLVSHNIQIPSDLPHVFNDNPLAMIEVLGDPDEPQRIRAHMPAFDAAAPYPFERDPAQDTTRRSRSASTELSGVRNYSHPLQSNIPRHEAARHPYGLDSSQVGIDFVLALEHPCLYHHQLPNPQLAGGIGTGHELMVSSPVMRAPGAPGVQMNGQNPRLPTSSRWNVPAIELEKLLSFTEGLDLDGEITPIQAWQRIRIHPNFLDLTPIALATLRESLLTVVQCYGFGAVIDETYFDQMIDQTFRQVQ